MRWALSGGRQGPPMHHRCPYHAGVTTARDVLQRPTVRRYLGASVSASLGLNIIVTVLFKQAFDITGNELDIGWIGLAQFVPAVLLVLVSGWAADRFDRRRVSAVSLVGRGLCAVGLVVYSWGEPGRVWPIFLIAFVFGAADAMLAPSARAIPPLVCEARELPQVIALWNASFTGAAILGPIVGGLLYSIGPGVAYGVGAALQMVAAVVMLTVVFVRQPKQLTERPSLRTAVEGLSFIRRTPIVLAAISLDLFAVLFGGAVALIPAVASERLGVGDIGYGFLRAAPGVGAAAMAVMLAVRPLRRRVGPTLLVTVAIFGIGTIVFGVTRNYAVAFVALVVLSAADMISMFIRGSMVPLATPDDQLGRVTAVEGVFIGASNELGAFESGVAARFLGVAPAIALGGIMTVIVATSFAWLFPGVRRLDRFDELVSD